MNPAIIVDTETTDADAPIPVEVAYLRLSASWGILPIGRTISERFNPGKPISYGAMAVHHITDDDVKDCKPFSSFHLPGDPSYIIGHQIDFDWRALGEPNVKRICTMALCRMIWPLADAHTLTAMLYYLDMPYARENAPHAHGAAADVEMCYRLLHIIMQQKEMASAVDYETLWQLSEKARIPTVMGFGKHKGMAVKDVPRDYKDWMLRQPDCDPYLRIAFTKR